MQHVKSQFPCQEDNSKGKWTIHPPFQRTHLHVVALSCVTWALRGDLKGAGWRTAWTALALSHPSLPLTHREERIAAMFSLPGTLLVLGKIKINRTWWSDCPGGALAGTLQATDMHGDPPLIHLTPPELSWPIPWSQPTYATGAEGKWQTEIIIHRELLSCYCIQSAM